MEYTLNIELDGATETQTIEASSTEEAVEMAKQAAFDWAEDGDWHHGDGVDGPLSDVTVFPTWELIDEDGDDVDHGTERVTIEPPGDAIERAIRRAGGDPRCDHKWVANVETEGGCDSNPGVWAGGGTTVIIRDHCAHCGVGRRQVVVGAQRDPGEEDSVQFFPLACDDDADCDE